MKQLLFGSLLVLLAACGGDSEESTTENDQNTYAPLPHIGFHDVDYNTGDSIYHTVGSWELMNHDSVVMTQADVEGKVHVANFFFTSCPAICPAMIEQMKRLQEMTADVDEIMFLSHTIDPARDTIPKLRKFIADKEIDTRNWNFLYGEKEYVYMLGEDAYMINAMEDEEADGGFLHSEHFVLIDRDGHIRGLYEGTNTDQVDQMAEDIKALIENEYN